MNLDLSRFWAFVLAVGGGIFVVMLLSAAIIWASGAGDI